MKIKAYDMDDEQTFDEMKESYQNHIDQIIDFDEDDYGYGPMVFLEGYIGILGAYNCNKGHAKCDLGLGEKYTSQ